MTQTKVSLQILCEIISFLVCLVLFISVYFYPQIDAFIKGRYTLTNSFVEAEALEFPTITICMNTGQKKSVRQKFDLWAHDTIFFHDMEDKSLIEVYNEMSYELGRDFDIFLNNDETPVSLGKLNFTGISGYDEITGGTMEVIEVRTMEGKCYSIIPKFEVVKDYGIDIGIFMSSSLKAIDFPISIQLIFTSNKTWVNVADQSWPQIAPSIQFLKFGQAYSDFSVNLVEYYFNDGNENITECQTSLALKTNCSTKCHILSGYDLPTCQNSEDFQCVHTMKGIAKKEWTRCQMVKKFNVYSIARTDASPPLNAGPQYCNFYVGMYSMVKQIREEIRIISVPDLIGSVGGSLGMFFGFSFAATCSFWIKKIFSNF